MNELDQQRLGWYLFQFSGEILLTNGVLYFLPWLTNLGVSDSWFNWALIGTSIVLLLTGFFAGRSNDQKQIGYGYLLITSFFMFVFTIGIHMADTMIANRKAKGLVGLFCFSGIMYFFQLGLIFYNSMLRQLSSPTDYIKISGRAVAAGWVGALIGILAVWPFVEGLVPYFRPAGRGQAFLPSAMFYGVGTALSLFLMRGLTRSRVRLSSEENGAVPGNNSEAGEDRQIWFFLIALFLFADAVLTIEANATYYLSTVMHFSENGTNTIFLLLIVMAAAGALIPARLRSTVPPKTMLVGILIGWVCVLILISVTTNRIAFAFLFALIGVVYGALFAVMRAFFLSLLPAARTSRYFAFYVSFQRFSTLVGPLVWIMAAYFARGLGANQYRISMLTMAALICLSFVFLSRVSKTTSDKLMFPGSQETSE
jgi:UMF1 family MFS transporter